MKCAICGRQDEDATAPRYVPEVRSDCIRTIQILQDADPSYSNRWKLGVGYFRPKWWSEEWAYRLSPLRGTMGEVEVCSNHVRCLSRAAGGGSADCDNETPIGQELLDGTGVDDE